VIHYRNDVRRSGIDDRALRSATREILQALNRVDATVSLWIVNDEKMRELNRAHRKKDKPTDVLSFPLDRERFLGDIVISADTAKRQAAEYDAPLQREVERLLIHGMLHLLGHDHLKPTERRRMRAEERRLAHVIGMPWPY
jgi:probable rRNA maturation factor